MKLLSLLSFFCLMPFAFAAQEPETAWLGDYAVALSRKNPIARINSMLDCASSSRPRSKDAMQWIIHDLPLCDKNAVLCRRLMLFWSNDPERLEFAAAVFPYLQKNGIPPEEIEPLLAASVKSVCWENCPEKRRELAFSLIELETGMLFEQQKYDAAEAILQHLTKKGAPQNQLHYQQFFLYSNICRKQELRPPFRRDAASPWQEKREKQLKFFEETEDILEEQESLSRLVFYLSCRLPGTKRFALKLKKRFPRSQKITETLIGVGLLLEDADILREIVPPDVPALLLFSGQYEKLRQVISSRPPEDQAPWHLKALMREQRWQEAEKLAEALPANYGESQEDFSTLLTLFRHTGSLFIWEKLTSRLLKEQKSSDPGDFAMRANALAYTALLRGKDLPLAEQLLNFALTGEPQNAAYLDSMAFLRYRQGRYAEAKILIRDSLRRCSFWEPPEEILFHAAQIEFSLTKDKAKCRTLIEAALRFASENEKTELSLDEVKRFQQELR